MAESQELILKGKRESAARNALEADKLIKGPLAEAEEWALANPDPALEKQAQLDEAPGIRSGDLSQRMSTPEQTHEAKKDFLKAAATEVAANAALGGAGKAAAFGLSRLPINLSKIADKSEWIKVAKGFMDDSPDYGVTGNGMSRSSREKYQQKLATSIGELKPDATNEEILYIFKDVLEDIDSDPRAVRDELQSLIGGLRRQERLAEHAADVKRTEEIYRANDEALKQSGGKPQMSMSDWAARRAWVEGSKK